MSALDTRTVATLVAVVALGTLAAPVAADGGESDVTVDAAPTGNSTVIVDTGLAADGNGGEENVTCTGSVLDHECDKNGSLTAGPLSVDYTGDNYANVTALRGGGGDAFEVRGANESLLVGFDCDLNTNVSAESCSVTANSSQGSLPTDPPSVLP
jgi:hypothetical protein